MKRTVSILILVLLAGCAAPGQEPEAPPALVASSEVPSAPVNQTTLAVNLAVPALVRTDHVAVGINVTMQAWVTVEAAGFHEALDVNGTASVKVPLAPGRTDVNVTADDGFQSVVAQATVVRETAATLNIHYNNYPGQVDSQQEVWLDVHAYPSAPMYEAQGAQHPGFANVHDFLIAWEEQTGNEVTYGWSDSFSSFSVSQINGAGNPVTASAPPWWCYGIEGRDSVLGITLEPFEPGMVVTWDLGTCTG